jgi:glycosyltransferase involved in cell wall biosynthesis
VPGRLSIAHVTPYPWEAAHEVNEHVRRVAEELAARGHHVLIVAPSNSQALVREGRRAVRGGELFAADGAPRILAVGEALPPLTTRTRSAALPIDVARTIEALFEHAALDLCHVHEPFAPSVASTALRHSRALNVGTFHAPAERIVSTQVARRVVQLVFGRLDARVASFGATRDLMQRFFPADYRVVTPGADRLPRPARDAGAPVRIAYVDEEERAGLRLFLRALRRLDPALPWEASVLTARGAAASVPLRADLRARLRFVEHGEDALLAASDVVVAASDGAVPQPGLVLRAHAAGAAALVSRIPVYEEVVGDGERGLVFEVRDADTLAAALHRLVVDEALRDRLRGAAAPRPWAAVAEDLEGVYLELAARRHDGRGDPALRARLAAKGPARAATFSWARAAAGTTEVYAAALSPRG